MRHLRVAPSRRPPLPVTSRRPLHTPSLWACPRGEVDGVGGAARQYRGFFDCMRAVARAEGVSALYRGLGATIVKGVPNTGIQVRQARAASCTNARPVDRITPAVGSSRANSVRHVAGRTAQFGVYEALKGVLGLQS